MVAVIVTFCDGVKPLSGAALVAVPAKYAPLLSAAYCSSYVARLRRSDFIAATYALSFVLANFGIAIAARTPMMTTTIKSSIRVNPCLLRDIACVSSTVIFYPATPIQLTSDGGAGNEKSVGADALFVTFDRCFPTATFRAGWGAWPTAYWQVLRRCPELLRGELVRPFAVPAAGT